jgi:hypothetical protein
MLIRNIANDRDSGGYFYSSESYHPNSNHLPVEPWLGDSQLRFDESREFPDSLYFSHVAFLEALKEHKIISFTRPIKVTTIPIVSEKKEKPSYKVIDIEEPTAFATEEKNADISSELEKVEEGSTEEIKEDFTLQDLGNLTVEEVIKVKKKSKK